MRELKCWPLFFEPTWTGKKTFEVRRTDNRRFAAGDVWKLVEVEAKEQKPTGRWIDVRIVRPMNDFEWGLLGFKELAGFTVFGFEVVRKGEA